MVEVPDPRLQQLAAITQSGRRKRGALSSFFLQGNGTDCTNQPVPASQVKPLGQRRIQHAGTIRDGKSGPWPVAQGWTASACGGPYPNPIFSMQDDERCCGTGTCIIDAQGTCWCGQQWDGEKMCRPPLAEPARGAANEPSPGALGPGQLLDA